MHLFEAGSYFGGHANTVSFMQPGKDGADSVDVDTYVLIANGTIFAI